MAVIVMYVTCYWVSLPDRSQLVDNLSGTLQWDHSLLVTESITPAVPTRDLTESDARIIMITSRYHCCNPPLISTGLTLTFEP